MKKYHAYISKVTDIRRNIVDIFDYIHWRELVRSDSTGFIKPNFTIPFYKVGITTNPLVSLKIGAAWVIIGKSDRGVTYKFKMVCVGSDCIDKKQIYIF